MAKDITLNPEQVFGNEAVILTAKGALYDYANGNKSENIIGSRYTVSSPDRNFQTFSIKVLNQALLDISDEMIDEACASMNPIFVKFDGFKAKPYSNGKGISYSCSAKGIEIVDREEALGGLELFDTNNE